MAKNKYTKHKVNIVRDFDSAVNCDSLVYTIANLYFKYEDLLELEDAKKILSMAQRIEMARKHLPTLERESMYKIIADFKQKYKQY